MQPLYTSQHTLNHNFPLDHHRNHINQHNRVCLPPSNDLNSNLLPPRSVNNKIPTFKPLHSNPSCPFSSSPFRRHAPVPPPKPNAPSKPSILLPSLLSTTNTNTNSGTDTTATTAPNCRTPIPSITPPTQQIPFQSPICKENATRKRTAAEMMMNESPTQTLICDQGKKPKRQKTETEPIKSTPFKPLPPKRPMPSPMKKASYSKKMKHSVAQLKAFADKHNGRLPSLRYVMKMLKVGFPKAHEIMDEFARVNGKSKDQVVQDMTIRQEKMRKGNKKELKTPSPSYKGETPPPRLCKHERINHNAKSNMSINCNDSKVRNVMITTVASSAALPTDFSKRLEALLSSVAEDKQWDTFEKQYLWNLNKLEVFLDEYVKDNCLTSCDLSAKVNIATAFYVLGEIYYSKCRKLHVGFEYNEKALLLFKQCNVLCKDYRNTSVEGDGPHSQDVKRYLGIFWREFVQIFVLRGDMLLDKEDFKRAQRNYELSYDLVLQSSSSNIETKNECLRQTLEKLTVVHSYQRQYALCTKYGKLFLRELIQSDQASSKIKSIIESKAWLSCNLMLSSQPGGYRQGYQCYQDIMKELNHRIDANDPWKYFCVCYYAEHFIRIKEWNEAHRLMEHVLSINEYVIGDTLRQVMHDAFSAYVECALECLDTMPMDSRKVNNILLVLHEKHMNVINEMNLRAKMKQKDYKTKNEKLKRKNHGENTNNLHENDDDYNEDIDLILSDKFNYNVQDIYNSLYPKINIASVLIKQITLLLGIGNMNAAHQILYNLVIPRSKCLNTTSKYWQHYPIHKISQNEINALLSLL